MHGPQPKLVVEYETGERPEEKRCRQGEYTGYQSCSRPPRRSCGVAPEQIGDGAHREQKADPGKAAVRWGAPESCREQQAYSDRRTADECIEIIHGAFRSLPGLIDGRIDGVKGPVAQRDTVRAKALQASRRSTIAGLRSHRSHL